MINIESLENVRKKRGFTQEQMADKLGIAVSTYCQYESGKRSVPAESAEKICRILKVNTNRVFLPQKFTVSKS